MGCRLFVGALAAALPTLLWIGAAHPAPGVPAVVPCLVTFSRHLSFPAAVEVDEVEVRLTPDSPPGGGALIRLNGEENGRSLRVYRSGTRLRFWPPLRSAQLDVTVSPLEAAREACVERIVLRGRGQQISSVRVR
jgi:hypothetical protein